MNAADKKELVRYVRWCADEMGLRDWALDIHVDTDFTEGGFKPHNVDDFDAMGSCEPTPGQSRALIRFHPDVRKSSREELREIVVHELVHCHLFRAREFMRTGVLEHVGQSTYNALAFGYDQEWEHSVDGIARPWAEKIPLIKWPSENGARRS
jgi:hypothetical protein